MWICNINSLVAQISTATGVEMTTLYPKSSCHLRGAPPVWNTFAQSLCNGFLVAANRDFCRKTITREYAAAAARSIWQKRSALAVPFPQLSNYILCVLQYTLHVIFKITIKVYRNRQPLSFSTIAACTACYCSFTRWRRSISMWQ